MARPEGCFFVKEIPLMHMVHRCFVAFQLLEVHVSDDLPVSKESEELVRGRQALGLALCNRSLANLRVGNAYNAKVRVSVHASVRFGRWDFDLRGRRF